MKLTKEELNQLKEMRETQWFKILERIEKEERQKLWEMLLTADLNDENQMKIIRENQIYVKARQDFLRWVTKRTDGKIITTI